jgi:hypothetical protein
MPEPSDPLSERLAAAPGLPTLLAEARATWLARMESEADANAEAIADRDADAGGGDPPANGGDPPADSRAESSMRRPPSTPRWRAFEDAFPTFYQFTNRPRS